jgi:hypothetical protein
VAGAGGAGNQIGGNEGDEDKGDASGPEKSTPPEKNGSAPDKVKQVEKSDGDAKSTNGAAGKKAGKASPDPGTGSKTPDPKDKSDEDHPDNN